MRAVTTVAAVAKSAPVSATDGDELAVHPHRFREQLEYLARNGYRVVDVLELADLLDAGELPPRTIALNFDDAGSDDVRDQDDARPVELEHPGGALLRLADDAVDRRLAPRARPAAAVVNATGVPSGSTVYRFRDAASGAEATHNGVPSATNR